MINRVLIYFLIVLSLSPQTFAGGYDSGNGGLILVCMDKHTRLQVNKIQFYDLWFWSEEGLSPEALTFREDLKPYPQGVENLIQEISVLVPKYEADLWREYEILNKKIAYYLRQYEQGYNYDYLSRTDDYRGRLSPQNFCNSRRDLPLEVANIARYEQNDFFVLSAHYFLALTETEKNGLVFHEVIYRVLEKYQLDLGEAFNTMEVTAIMMSTKNHKEKLPYVKRIMP